MNFDEILLGGTTRTFFKRWDVLPSRWCLPEIRQRQIVSASLRITLSFSPASVLDLREPLDCRHLVIGDGTLMLEKLFSREEFIAMLLHEIGHKLNPPPPVEAYLSLNEEFWADDFARACGFEEAILSSLEAMKRYYPTTCSSDDLTARAGRIRENHPLRLTDQN